MLRKKLTKIGNSYGVILSKEILDTVGIEPSRGCVISLEKYRLTIEPVRRKKNFDEEVSASMIRFMKKYRSDLEKLAK